ncbi:MAG TPA: O-antigen ligase family protein [Candidatus Acidoferrum sp.]|nr:O-antigen ligase family protein [Candidatus Acidoferrum sp.]
MARPAHASLESPGSGSGLPPAPGLGPREELLPVVFAVVFGAFLGLSMFKFGNPPILEKWVSTPTQFWEVVFAYPWPISWAYWMLGITGLLGAVVARRKLEAPGWLVALPLAWLIWEFIVGTQSVSAELTAPTLKHFGACVLCFYLGLFSLSRVRNPWPFWLGLLGGLLLVLQVGWEQHFGGLQATRRYFFLYLYQQFKEVPPEYLKRVKSSRIFATLFYPNALAGLLLLALPPAIGLIWDARRRLTAPARGLLIVLLGGLGLACLYWSGSKAGWLIMLLLGSVVLLRLPLSTQLKAGFIAVVLVCGLAGFFWKHSAFFQKGATSVGARFDYWHAALDTTWHHPAFGTGPGTFAIPYAKIKRPESEMARLVHDDYLQQASDSGVVGCLLYSAFVAGALVWSFRRGGWPVGGSAGIGSSAETGYEWLRFGVWLGVLGWSVQGLVEFGLYIPASAWPAFAFMGWMLGSSQFAWTAANRAPNLRHP